MAAIPSHHRQNRHPVGTTQWNPCKDSAHWATSTVFRPRPFQNGRCASFGPFGRARFPGTVRSSGSIWGPVPWCKRMRRPSGDCWYSPQQSAAACPRATWWAGSLRCCSWSSWGRCRRPGCEKAPPGFDQGTEGCSWGWCGQIVPSVLWNPTAAAAIQSENSTTSASYTTWDNKQHQMANLWECF